MFARAWAVVGAVVGGLISFSARTVLLIVRHDLRSHLYTVVRAAIFFFILDFN